MVKVILTENVPGQGKKDQVIEASEGFIRNFLLPQKKAVLATQDNLKKIKLSAEANKNNEIKLKQNLLEAKTKINKTEITLKKKISKDQKIFGSVTEKEIFNSLLRTGIKIESGKINFKNPLKATGDYTVEVVLSRDIKASLKVKIIGE